MIEASAARPRFYINSWAARTTQRIGARIIDSALAFCGVVVILVVGPHGRPLAQDLLIITFVTLIEGVALTAQGATIGMRVLGLRVSVVDRAGNPSRLVAIRRTVPVALCYPLLVPGLVVAMVMPWALLLSIALSPLRRGFHDRLSGTLVVQEDAPETITSTDLATWWEPGTNVVMSPWGRVPGLYDRRRARAHRLDGDWWLAGVIATITVASVGVTDVPLLWVWLTLVWMVIAGIDETWWLTTNGATPGHAAFGYRIVDITTGNPPTRARAILRSLVLVPLLYLPPLQLLLGLWVHSSSLHRGPHDLIARTVVVEPDFTPPSFAQPAFGRQPIFPAGYSGGYGYYSPPATGGVPLCPPPDHRPPPPVPPPTPMIPGPF